MKSIIQCVLALTLLGWSAVAPAQGTVTRNLSINLFGTAINGNSEFGFGRSGSRSLGAIVMRDPANGATSNFYYNFTLPFDYAPGTDIHTRVLWRSDSTSCAVNLRDNSLSLISPGTVSRQGGQVRPPGTMQVPGTQYVVNETRYRLSFSPYMVSAGDAIIASLYRSGTDDTCGGSLFIQGLSVVYEARTEGVFGDGFEAP